MAGPWEKYQEAPATEPASSQVSAAGPWQKYATPAAPAAQPGNFDDLIKATAQKYKLDPRELHAIAKTESNFNPRAVSPAGAQGLMQLMPATAAELGVQDPFDPAQNLEAGAKYYSQLLNRYKGNRQAARAAYNWGMGNLDKQGMKNMPTETRDYLARIEQAMGDTDVPSTPDVTPENPRQDWAGAADDLIERNRELDQAAATTGISREEYFTQKAEVAEEYYERTGKRPEWSGTEDITRGLGQGILRDPIQAVQQITDLRWAIPDVVERRLSPTGQTKTETEAGEAKALERYRAAVGEGGFDIGRLVGNIVNPASMATGGSGALPAWVAKLAPKGQAAVMAAMRGGIGAGVEPVDPSGTGGIAGQKAAQVGIGAPSGMIGEGVTRLVTKGAGHAAGAIADQMAHEEISALVKLSKDWGVDLLAGDYDNNRRILRGIEGRLLNSQIPGLNIDLRLQQKQAQSAASKLLSAQNKQMQSMTYTSLDKIREVAASDSRRSGEAKAILRMVDEAGTDARRVMQASGNLKWLRMKLSSDDLFDQVERIAGEADVPPNATLQALADAEKKAGTVVDVDSQTLQLISRWRQRLEGAPDEGEEALAEAAEGAVPNTYMRMREFLTDVRGRAEQATTAGTTKTGALWLKDIAKAVQADMDAFAEATPALKTANDRANRFYQDRVLPFQQPTMAKALKSDNPDEVYGAFVRSGADWKGDTAQLALYKALDPKGQAAVRSGILEDAFRQATDPEHFTPTGFNKILRQTGYETYFRGTSRTELDGLMHIMDRISRSDPAKLATFNPMLGNLASLGGIGMATGTAAPATVASALAATGAMKWLVTTNEGRRLLYSANLLKPGVAESGSKAAAWAQLLDNINRQVAGGVGRATGVESGRPQGNPRPQE